MNNGKIEDNIFNEDELMFTGCLYILDLKKNFIKTDIVFCHVYFWQPEFIIL